MGELVQGRLRDIYIAVLNQPGSQAIQHGQNQGADLIAVHVSIGTDDHFIPTKIGKVKSRQILVVLVFDLYTAAQNLDEVGDDLGLKDFIIFSLETVEDLTADRHNGLIFRVTTLLDRA